MRKIRDFIYDWLDREESFIFWMVAMYLVNSLTSWVISRSRGVSWGFLNECRIISCNIAISFFTVLVIDVILYLSLRKFKVLHKITKSFFLAVNVVLFLTDIFMMYYFNGTFSEAMLVFLFWTNMRESIEFAQSYLTNLRFYGFAVSMIALVVLLRFLWVKICNARPRLRFAVFVFCFMLSIFASGRQLYLINYLRAIRFIDSVGVTRLTKLLYTTHRDLKGYEKSFSHTPKTATLTKNESKIPYVVFILGESTTRKHMGLYGYKFPTNPLLSLRSLRGGG